MRQRPVTALDEDELVYQSPRTRIVRRRLDDGRPVIVKEPRGTGAHERLLHELAMVQRVAGRDGMPQLAVPQPVNGALVLDDSGYVPLAQVLTGMPMPAAELIRFAGRLTRLVATMHGCGVIHRDINPANIVADPASAGLAMIDFDLATASAHERLGFVHTTEIRGTPAYLAPEQTGRTGWPADHRADLYSLGATLYEVATGRPPFGRGEPLALIRSHLTTAPPSPAEIEPDVPEALAAIILKLLEKEPDRRYQTTAGLLYDLAELERRPSGPFTLGVRDFPVRLVPASRPVGRDTEIAALTALFSQVLGDPAAGAAVLVSGAAGTGKSSTIDQLRPLVTARDGWFVTGKFDEKRRDHAADGVWRSLAALGRLLLAEPDAELAVYRRRLVEWVGPNAGLIAAAVPEFATVLGVEPQEPDGDVEARMIRAATCVVAAVGTPERPLVLVLDDLQWAGPTAVAIVDALFARLSPGVLLVGAYRAGEVDSLHPLSARLSAWDRSARPPAVLALANLPASAVEDLLADLLRMTTDTARPLAEVVLDRTDGNPFDTVELVNALRQDQVLTLSGDGWSWDAGEIRRHIGSGTVVDLLAARIRQLPDDTLGLLDTLADLGDQVSLHLLATASARTATEVEELLRPALEDGLVMLETGGPRVVAFRHDRVRQAALALRDPDASAAAQLVLARRLAGHERFLPVAAAQYLTAFDLLSDGAEKRTAAGLFRTAARDALLTDPVLAERYLAAAVTLFAGTAVRIEHHAVLCGLGRFTEADEVYAAIEAGDPTRAERCAASRARIRGLRARNRQAEALTLGLDLLARFDVDVPAPAALAGRVDAGLTALERWVAAGGPDDDLARPDVTDPDVLAVAGVIDDILPAAYFSGNPIFGWLVTEAQRMWQLHGPCAALVPPLSHAGFMTVMLREDYRTGYRAARRVLTVSETRGYEPQTAHARFLFALGHGPWFEPLPEQVVLARRAREGFQYHGDVLTVFTYVVTIPLLLVSAPSLTDLTSEVEGALAAAARIGEEHTAVAFVGYRQMVRALRGETVRPGSLDDEGFELAAFLDEVALVPTSVATVRTSAAVVAAVFGDTRALLEHSAAAMALLPFVNATYLTSTTRLVRTLALFDWLSGTPGDVAARDELTGLRDWFAARAADSPDGFGHLLLLIDAELSRMDGDPWAAASGFDAAVRQVGHHAGPWHRALILERAGRFYTGRGLDHVGGSLLAQARAAYLRWGAVGKAATLDDAGPRTSDAVETATPGTMSVTTGTIDIMTVLEASRALSSATSPDMLRDRLAEVLGALTGATGINLLMWDETEGDWTVRGSAGDDRPVPVTDPAVAGRVPLSVLRYVQRTGAPVLIADALGDDRFARDPYLAGVRTCSMMAVPIESRGRPQALLLLEKRETRGAFTTDRLDTVTLVAGQLAVSIENVMVYASLERKVDERTQALAAANTRLEQLNRTDPLTGLANRRRLEEKLDAVWGDPAAADVPIGILMIDIDHFKEYNDHYGHLGGDDCLARVASALSGSARSNDLVARYGGEEFCIVLPGADAAAVQRVAERARLAVAALQREHARSATGFVTVSVGWTAGTPGAGGTPQELVERADRGLYEAKHQGRNRVAADPAGWRR